MNSGKTLKLLRLLKGYTQQQLANQLGISQQAYSKMENQKWIDSKKMEELLLKLNCTKEELESIKKLSSNKK